MAKAIIFIYAITPIISSFSFFFCARSICEFYQKTVEEEIRKNHILEEENRRLKSMVATMQGIQKR